MGSVLGGAISYFRFGDSVPKVFLDYGVASVSFFTFWWVFGVVYGLGDGGFYGGAFWLWWLFRRRASFCFGWHSIVIHGGFLEF